MKLKVCGLKFKENILDVAEAMPDYMGFIFYPKSKRYVGQDFALSTLDSAIKKVGVFVNENAEEIKKQILKHKLDLVQLHGDEGPEFCAEINKTTPVIKAFGITESFDFAKCADYKNSCTYFLFDTKTTEYGGSGIKFEWTALNKYEMDVPFFLSGGITMNDVSVIQRLKHPSLHAIDVNSGFETEPGFKNIKLLKQFANETRH